MKTKTFKILMTMLFAIYYSLSAGVEYDTSSTQKAVSRKKIADQELEIENEGNKLVGKTFWYVPDSYKKARIIFYSSQPVISLSRFLYANEEFYKEFEPFRPSGETTFEVTGFKMHSTMESEGLPLCPTYCIYYFEVKFPDGKIGYTNPWAADKRVGSSGLDNALESYIYTGKGSVSIDLEPIYTEPPEVITAREREEEDRDREKRKVVTAREEKAKMAAKKAAAEAKEKWNARGGISIGMTKTQVLASNWGGPRKVNKTTTANGIREQWVYGEGSYLYFDNGVLTAIQN